MTLSPGIVGGRDLHIQCSCPGRGRCWGWGGAGVKEEGEAVVGAVRCGRRGVGDGSEGVEVGQRGGAATVGEAVGGGRREVDGLEAGEVAAVVEVGRREVEVGGEVADQDEVVLPGQSTVQWAGWCLPAGLAATSGSAVACPGWCSPTGPAATIGSAVARLAGSCNVESLGSWLAGELMSA